MHDLGFLKRDDPRFASSIKAMRTLMGPYQIADVGLAPPIRDGINLVAKEFVAAQDPEDPGLLVLSTLAGAAHELREAILVNPYDIDEVADGINRALRMPLAERKQRHAKMMTVLRQNDIVAWRNRFVDALDASKENVAKVDSESWQ